jgi:cell wall assembly regulator SMI1
MVTLHLSDHFFKINDVEFSFPINIIALKKLLGEPRNVSLKHNNVYTWDNLGLLAYSKDGTQVETLMLNLTLAEYQFSPTNVFSGQLLLNGEDAIHYYKHNKNKRIKLSPNSAATAFIANGMYLWFDQDGETIDAIEISQHQAEVPAPQALPIDPAFAHLQTLWQAWINAIQTHVPSNNQYYNLSHGITQQTIEQHNQTASQPVPPALLNFYKINNVEYNAVTSAFSFSINNWQYDLLPFNAIQTHWESLQDIGTSFDQEDLQTDAISPKLNATSYANPNWIPFAEGRNGDYLLLDTDPSAQGVHGQIVEFQNESWQRNVVAQSLGQLLENEIKKTNNGEKDYSFIL